MPNTIMHIVLEKEAYARFSQEAKAQGLTTRELGKKVLTEHLQIK